MFCVNFVDVNEACFVTMLRRDWRKRWFCFYDGGRVCVCRSSSQSIFFHVIVDITMEICSIYRNIATATFVYQSCAVVLNKSFPTPTSSPFLPPPLLPLLLHLVCCLVRILDWEYFYYYLLFMSILYTAELRIRTFTLLLTVHVFVQ